MPLYDTSMVNSIEGPLNNKGKPMRLVDCNTLCTIFGIKTPKFPKEKHFQPPTIRPLQEEQVRKLAFQVEHLMTIMQEQIADKNIEEKLEIMTTIGEQYIIKIKPIVNTRKEILKMIMTNQKNFLISNFPKLKQNKNLSEMDEYFENQKENTDIKSNSKENNQKKNTETDHTVRVIVETEICRQIIQVFIIIKSLGLNLFTWKEVRFMFFYLIQLIQ